MKTEIKYAPKNLNEIVYPTAAVKQRINAYASMGIEGHVLLWGPNRTGKTAIAKLLPYAIDGANTVIDKKNADELLAIKDLKGYLQKSCEYYVRFGSCNKYFLVLHEFDCSSGRMDKFWSAIDDLGEMLMVIITTNNPMEIHKSIRARFDLINMPKVKVSDFLPRAQQILQAEGLVLTDAQVRFNLDPHEEHGELTRYLRCLDEMIYLNNNGFKIPSPPKKTKPVLNVVKNS